MSDIDFSKIRVGDKVKIRVHGLVSEDWMLVTQCDPGNDSIIVEPWQVWPGVDDREVIAHQPAPSKVEVTLGEPIAEYGLEADDREYRGVGGYGLSVVRCVMSDSFNVRATKGYTGSLTFPEARRLALDLLATVGTE